MVSMDRNSRTHQFVCTDCFVPVFCSLGFSVTIFCTEAVIAIGILLLRRNQSVSGGELGGPKCIKTITSLIFMCLWFVYIGLSAMEAYGVITPGI